MRLLCAVPFVACSSGAICAPANGVASPEKHIATGDQVNFIISPTVYRQPGHERLYLLTMPQVIGSDGAIDIPYLGPVPVVGLTDEALAQKVTRLLQPVFQEEMDLQVRIRR